MKIPYTNLHQQYIDCKTDIDEVIKSTISSSSFISGSDVDLLESTLSNYIDADDCASTGSGTTALLCSLRAANIGIGDEVITTPMTFVATTESIAAVGATPVFVDIDPNTYLIDLNLIEQAITSNTRAILFVDLYGQCPNIDQLRYICDTYNLVMIEDAAQSFGNKWNGKNVGTLADYTCVSFNPVKNLGAMGDAGCVFGKTKDMQNVRSFRDHGRKSRYSYNYIGYNARIDNLQANIIRAKLPYYNNWIKRKRKICNYYTEQLSNAVQTPIINPGNTHVYYGYVIRTKKRDHLKENLQNSGIQTNIQYATATHTQPAFSQWHTSCKETEKAVNEVLSLPSWYSMSDDQVEYVVKQVKRYL